LLLACMLNARLFQAEASGLMRKERVKKEPKSALRASFEELLGDDASERLFEVEESIRPSYEAFPKNSLGHLPVREILPAMVRGYFAKEQGWLIKGLEPPRIREDRAELQGAEILRVKAPSLVAALDSLAEADRGVSLSDVVGIVAALEHLITDEVVALLRPSYMYNDATQQDVLNEAAADEILASYILLLRHGAPYNFTNVDGHHQMKARATSNAESWKALVDFIATSKAKLGARESYLYEDISKMGKDIAMRFGQWQNWECQEMKSVLMSLEEEAGSGRVPYATFHAQPGHAVFQFTETEEYLTNTASLDGKDVLISNYVLGPSNCIASSEYFSVCCLNECEAIMSDLESSVQSPVLPPERLVEMLQETKSSTVQAGRQLEQETVLGIHDAAVHEGLVALHSAEFGAMLHEIYPNECPRLTKAETLAEDAERSIAVEWEMLQKQCTRVPDWHTRAEEM